MPKTDVRDLYNGLIRMHVLHHACNGPVYGLWMIEELGGHGYKLSPGTIYPILHGLERRGLLTSENHRNGRHTRRHYRITSAGRRAMQDVRQKVQELFGELFENELRRAIGSSTPNSVRPKRANRTKRRM